VFAHCDLLSGNIIVRPSTGADDDTQRQMAVTFIDYEYATPSPAAFDIANHFAEWAGIDCDYNAMPTLTQRRSFIREYVRTYFSFLPTKRREECPINSDYLEAETAKLFEEVDAYRGIPGLYWGIWSVIQAVISDIDFDYASYAELRLDEYWAWRAQREGSLATKGSRMQLRENKWAQEG
jgi:ethanolamine kinase